MRPCRTPPLSQHVYAEADRIAPRRATGGDGTCPSAAHHQQNPISDHEPFYGLSHALDLTHSPDRGLDAHRWARIVAGNVRAGLETRVKYLISDGQIATNGIWRPFYGDPHRGHWHTSWRPGVVRDTRPFLVDKTGDGAGPPPQVEEDDDMQMILDPLRDPGANGRVPHFIVDHRQKRIFCLNGSRIVRDTPGSTGVRYWPIPSGAVPIIAGAAALRTLTADGKPVLPTPQIVVAGAGGATWAVHIGKP